MTPKYKLYIEIQEDKADVIINFNSKHDLINYLINTSLDCSDCVVEDVDTNKIMSFREFRREHLDMYKRYKNIKGVEKK